jgi:hypothetical protein
VRLGRRDGVQAGAQEAVAARVRHAQARAAQHQSSLHKEQVLALPQQTIRYSDTKSKASPTFVTHASLKVQHVPN